MSEGTKRSVCKALGCNYDKCQWRDDGYGEGYIEEVSSGQYDGGYSGAGGGGGGYTIREYKTVEVVKEERADKYTGGETMEEYEEQVDEYKEDVVKVEEVVKEEDVTEIATPGYISHKVDTTKDSYGSTCDDVSISSDLSLQFFAYKPHCLTIQPFTIGCENILLQSKYGHPSRENISLRPTVMCLAEVRMGKEEWVGRRWSQAHSNSNFLER